MGFTYRDAGVDIDEKTKAKVGFESWLSQTYNESVLSSPGSFGGAIRLDKRHTHLSGALGWMGSAPDILKQARDGLKGSPFAFLDYIASSSLKGEIVLDIVKEFSQNLTVPLIGGETAEMPKTFQAGQEVVGALFGLAKEGAALRLDRYDNPMLVFSIDGVGTKTRLALKRGKTAHLLHDLVHHSLNDILCLGATGIGFLLYIGCHSKKDVPEWDLKKIFSQRGLTLLECAIVENPHLYQPGEIDLCGAIAGIAEHRVWPEVEPGDVLIGIPSNGLHTNGYSLAQKVLEHSPDEEAAESMLLPHLDYSPVVLPILPLCKGIAHITGGGIQDNLVRVFPEGLGAEIRMGSWNIPPVFTFLQEKGNIPLFDPINKGMFETFNMGIGMILIMKEQDALQWRGPGYLIGSVVENHKEQPHERVLFL